LLPLTLPSLCSCSHASCLPQLVVVLPLVLRRLGFSSPHRLLSGGASICPPLILPPPLVVPLFFSGALASRPPRQFVVFPLVTPLPPVSLRLCLSSHCCLSLCPSHISCLHWLSRCLSLHGMFFSWECHRVLVSVYKEIWQYMQHFICTEFAMCGVKNSLSYATIALSTLE
jgi:hypothetical protein